MSILRQVFYSFSSTKKTIQATQAQFELNGS